MTNFSLNEYKSMFLEPRRIVEPISWIKHIPFAFFITELLKPKIVVELGVHTGNSFSAFCQAVKNLNVKASCYGVDTFKGDPHSGVYDESVYTDVNNYITENYGDFAQVMRMTFDEALEYFNDGSIDLLHIDGYHTYEAVKLDFERWVPKMSDRGVILLHDTQVRRDEFGAWKLWEEIFQLYPSYKFKFGYGLGVLAVGKNVPDIIIKFIDEAREKIFIARLFFTLGSNTEFRTRIQSLEGEVADIKKAITEKDERVRELEVSLEDRNQHIQSLEGEVADIKKAITEKDEKVGELEASLEDRNQHIQSLEGEVADVRKAIAQKDEKVGELEASLEDRNQHIQSLEGEVADVRKAIAQKDDRIREIEMENLRINTELNSMKSSVTWRTVMKWHSLVEKLMPPMTRKRRWYDLGIIGLRTIANEGWGSFWWKFKQHMGQNKIKQIDYDLWIQKNEPKKEELERMREECKNFEYKPKISIITPVWNTDEKWLRAAIESVLNQVYDNWELCIADGGSTKPHVKKILKEYAKKDKRIKVKFLPENKGIAGNSNEALSLATGEFVGLLDHDDELTPFALYEVVKLLNEKPGLDFIYSDEDKIDEKGRREDPFFKPDWSPDLILSCMYTCHLGVYRKELVDKIGGFREGYEGSQDYDFVLRFIEYTSSERIAHIPKILYHWRKTPESIASNPKAKSCINVASAKKALKDALDRRGIKGIVSDGKWISSYCIKREILGFPKVSIIIPTKDRRNLLKNCIDSIKKKTTYSNYELIVVDNESADPETIDYLNKLDDLVVSYPGPFNFSKINNFAVNYASGEYILFLNNDTEVITPDWIEALLEHAQRPEVGAVGCKLLYPDKTIQHAGVILGLSPDPKNKVAGHIFIKHPYDNPGYFGLIDTIRNYSAVTAAVMMVRKNVFKGVGGFDENLAISYNDVDLCLKIRNKDYLIVYTPFAELFHYESGSRGSYLDENEVEYMLKKWGSLLKRDPYYNPNLSLRNVYCEVRL